MPTGVVLIVEDDDQARTAMRDVLVEAGFPVAEATTGRAALTTVAGANIDLVLLDLGLPDTGGLDVLVELTRSFAVPVLVVSGRAGETDRVVGLDLGADDYIVKPFGARELVARVRAAYRRHASAAVTHLMFDHLAIDERTHEATVDGAMVDLTPREFDLLVFLARAPRQVFSKGQLLRHVWKSSDQWQDVNTVAEHVYRLRRKLDPTSRERWIETVRGVGYRFNPGREASPA